MANENVETTEEEKEVVDDFEVDDDGNLIVYPDEDKSEPGADSDKEQSEEVKQEDLKKVDDSSKEFDEKYPTYKGKSLEDVVEMHKKATKKITEQSTRASNAAKLLSEKELTFEEKLNRLKPEDIDNQITKEQNKILEMDPEAEDYDKLVKDIKGVIQVLQTAYSKNYLHSVADEKINERLNEEFIPRMRKNYSDDGIDMSEEEFSDVTEIARKYTDNGILTESSYHKAIIDKYGAAKFTKFFEVKGGENTRKDMAETKGKETKSSGTGGGRTGGIKFEELKGRQRDEKLRNLSPTGLQLLKDRLPKQF